MTSKLHISLAQMNPIVGGLDYNFKKICDIWNSVPKNTDLVVFPEMAICGYPPEDLVLNQSFLDEVKKSVENLVAFSKGKAAAILPSPWVIDGKIHNVMHVIEDGKITATQSKHHLPNYGVFDEQRVFTAGPLPDPIKFHGFSLGLMLCEDMWYPKIAKHLKKGGAEILVVPNASPFESGKKAVRHKLAADRIKETGLPLIYVHQVGGQDELIFDGGSFVMNEKGHILLEGDQFAEHTYHVLLEKNDKGVIFGSVENSTSPFSPQEEIYQALMLGLRDYIGKNNFPGILIGLSGGIDSALSAAIAVDALGPERVHGIMMPSIYTSSVSMADAQALAKNLGIQVDEISIEKTVDALQGVLSPHIKDAPSTTFENIQPRARGVILMALSNASGKMVLSTGNKSEMAVGYATLYGDMCGGFNVLKDVYKTQVYELSNWRNKHKPRGAFGPASAPIPQNSINRAPTAELRENQTDQDTLPPYETLDAILKLLVEEELSVNEIVILGHDRDTVLKIWGMLDRAEYKRRQAAPGIKITRRAFGRDRRYPITNHFVRIIENS
jgi:NAD+ synthase